MAKAQLSLLLSAVESCQELWQLLQTVGRLDGCYKLSAALTDVASCQQLWKLLQVVGSFYSCYKLSAVFTAVTSRRQLWKLLQAVDSYFSCYELCWALTALTWSQQLWNWNKLSTAFTAACTLDPVSKAFIHDGMKNRGVWVGPLEHMAGWRRGGAKVQSGPSLQSKAGLVWVVYRGGEMEMVSNT